MGGREAREAGGFCHRHAEVSSERGALSAIFSRGSPKEAFGPPNQVVYAYLWGWGAKSTSMPQWAEWEPKRPGIPQIGGLCGCSDNESSIIWGPYYGP